MPTLWQILLKNIQPNPPVETTIYNPLKAKINGSINLDVIDLRSYNFFIREIRENTRTIGGKTFSFVDYVLLTRPIGEEDIWIRLRLMPITDPDKDSDLTHNALLLKKYDEFGYNKEFQQLLGDPQFIFNEENNDCTRTFSRINDVKWSYKDTVKYLDSSVDGIKTEDIEYWDYWRDCTDEAGQPTQEFLFVEMEKDNGYFTLWTGQEINPQRVNII